MVDVTQGWLVRWLVGVAFVVALVAVIGGVLFLFCFVLGFFVGGEGGRGSRCATNDRRRDSPIKSLTIALKVVIAHLLSNLVFS